MLEPPSRPSRTLDQLAGDVAAALISATLASPAIVIIDRAVVEKTASGESLLRALWKHTVRAAARPRTFFFSRPFAIIWTLYAATYTVASCSDTLGRKYQIAAASATTFLATTAINVPLGIWKDIRFAQIFSHLQPSPTTIPQSSRAAAAVATAIKPTVLANTPTASVPTPPPPPPVVRRMPRSVAAVFLARDAITLFGSITLAPRVAAGIPDALVANAHAKAAASQLTVPALTQLVATPVHLLGLDLYQRQGSGISLADRLAHTAGPGSGLAAATFARCLRILPAFGVGVLANQELRLLFHGAARAG
ncbi:putative enoyl- hydratase conserved site [Rosellinia necatrix]|uniref:Putative enoyl-hydratase conserved site n=1 Tax=Rosellinia necatrix TaxID=77044 RepID=A0A1W2TUF6_ROSNE|nr:putative enoyl- hydratase conserved site [Rosellinia necatrix]